MAKEKASSTGMTSRNRVSSDGNTIFRITKESQARS